MILMEEGYITFSGATPMYHYYLKDHQGNNRVVMNQNGGIEQVNHYYPFGGLFGEGLQTVKQPYKYNGKELDRFEGLDMYDYGARMYDAALGRWGSVDPMAEKYYSISPYVYVGNNPINKIDPDGMDEWEINKNKGQVTWIRESEGHFLFSLNKKGERTGRKIEVENRDILDQLSKANPFEQPGIGESKIEGDTRFAYTTGEGGEELLKVFEFAASNTDVEWAISFGIEGSIKKYALVTHGLENQTTSMFGNSLVTSIHSHPLTPNNYKKELDSMFGDRMNSKKRNYHQYIYMPLSKRLFSVQKGNALYIRNIKGDYKRFINMGIK